MSIWDHLPVRNIICAQRMIAIDRLERQIAEDHKAGYDIDSLLDEWARLLKQVQEGPIA